MRILGIETSCDETAVAVVEVTRGRFSVLSNIVASQVKIHAKTGGVVPEVAAREHLDKIIPVVQKALSVRTTLSDVQAAAQHLVLCRQVDVIAVTTGPGLATSLSVGVEVARTLAWLWEKPIVAVNHLAGHIYANWLNRLTTEPQTQPHVLVRSHQNVRLPGVEFPVLCLVVSGGHTELVLMKKHLDFEIIGSTRDDAAGECFDKVAKMLGLGYPGGPAISALAEKFQITNHKSQTNSKSKNSKPNYLITQLPNYPIFPRPMIDSPDYDFSFSGLKTAVLYYIKTLKYENIKALLPEICYEFQEAVVDVLVAKTIRAAKKYKVKTILIGGGVAANARLRQQLAEAVKCYIPSSVICLPSISYTTDNAAMIAVAGYFMARVKQFTHWNKLDVDPNWELGQKFSPIL